MSSDNTKYTQENIPISLTNSVSEVSSNHEKTEIERASETNKKPGRIFKETPNALRNSVSEVSSNNEKSEIETVSEASRKARGIFKASVVCKIIKYAIFLTCFSFLFQQSMDFYYYYVTYPITTSIVVRNSKIVKKPAITICNHNPYQNYIITQKGSMLSIDELIYESYFNLSQDSPPFIESNSRWTESMQPVLIFDPMLEMHKASYVKCFSSNLHLLDNEYPETQEEEEHLQPAPYPTDCTDYVALWEKNNKTGPRSQENNMSSEILHCIAKHCFSPNKAAWFETRQTTQKEYTRIHAELGRVVSGFSDSCIGKRRKNINECRMNCKPDCVKDVQYPDSASEKDKYSFLWRKRWHVRLSSKLSVDALVIFRSRYHGQKNFMGYIETTF
ncbi:hypothetical protein CEXT_335431 [Caerostris extrusa]|uniref:Uncharacterized protein n=1 Tax=Caerostris extrusa TaxID=172846 RepID=A0AAV4XNQ3_CAEEX|nr:hypothetical protein CEXT_335431 [Caerostris extrusa]